MKRRLRLSIKGTFQFGILIGLTLWLWILFRSYLLFLALILIMGSADFSVFLLWYHRDRLRVEMKLPEGRVGREQWIPLQVQVHNFGKFAGFTADISYHCRNLFTEYEEHEKEHLWVAPIRGNLQKDILSSRYAGRIEVCVDKFVVYDFFHIVYLCGCEAKNAEVTVWPAFPEGEETEEVASFVEGFPQENELRKRGTDYNPDYEIREYIPGDELKSIHWKLSAKHGKMMVRERLATGREKINVLLPLGEDRDENDKLIEAMYSIGRLLLNKGYPVQFYYPDRQESLQGCFIAELGELENVLTEILSGSGLHRPGVAQQQMAVEHPGESYILIQTGVSKGAYIQ